ncbi:Hypothetical protein D9617_17g048010 [Elsinoe fawcettii]|nr:Hypothetical protein D9617_17g048010 [Elsinoe fawcettii]
MLVSDIPERGTGTPPELEFIEETPLFLIPGAFDQDAEASITQPANAVWFSEYEIVQATKTVDADNAPVCTTLTEHISMTANVAFEWSDHGQLDKVTAVTSDLPTSVRNRLRYVTAEQYIFTAIPTLVVVRWDHIEGAFNETSPGVEVGAGEFELPEGQDIPVDLPTMPSEDGEDDGPQTTMTIGTTTFWGLGAASVTPPPAVTVIGGQVIVNPADMPKIPTPVPQKPPPTEVKASSLALPSALKPPTFGDSGSEFTESGGQVGLGGFVAAGIGSEPANIGGNGQQPNPQGRPVDGSVDVGQSAQSGQVGQLPDNQAAGDNIRGPGYPSAGHGQISGGIKVYDVIRQEWLPAPPWLQPESQPIVDGVSGSLAGSAVGEASGSATRYVQVYDPIRQTWLAIPASPQTGSEASQLAGDLGNSGQSGAGIGTSFAGSNALPISESGTTGSTPFLFGDSVLVPTTGAVYYIAGQQVVSGGPPIIVEGKTIRAPATGGGLVIDGRFVGIAASDSPTSMIVEGLEVFVEPTSGYSVNGSILQAGAAALNVGRGTTVSLGPSALAVISGNRTTLLGGQHMTSGPMLMSLGPNMHTANAASHFRIRDDITLSPGSWTSVSKTRLALATKASAAMVNGVQISLSPFITPAPQISLAGTVYVPNAGSSYLLNGSFLTPGGQASIPSYSFSLHPDCINVVINNVTIPLSRPSLAYPSLRGTSIFAPPHLTLDNIIYTPLPPAIGGGYNISSTHLSISGTLVLTGPHGASTLSLLPSHTLRLSHNNQTYISTLPLHPGIHPASPLPPLLTVAQETFTALPGDLPRYILNNVTLTAGRNATATFSSRSPSKIVDGELAEVKVTVLTIALARNLSALTIEEKGERRTEALFPATARAWEEVQREREREGEGALEGEGAQQAAPAGGPEGGEGRQEGEAGRMVVRWGVMLGG